jgi:D-3-phosphoglycerate dehydrogenase
MKEAQTSYPRSKIKILLLENISDSAIEELKASGYAEIKKHSGALGEADLIKEIKGVHILGIGRKRVLRKRFWRKPISC